MGSRKDITNQRYGHFTALCPTGEMHDGRAVWRCRCDCGNEIDVVVTNLSIGRVISCGCVSETNLKGQTSKTRLIDLTGQRFGNWTVLSRAENGNGHNTRWKCRCDCGKEKVVYASHLKRGLSKSCGCTAHEKSDLTGERRGSLIAVRRTEKKDKKGKYFYEWRCDCGCTFFHTAAGENIRCPACTKVFRANQAAEARKKLDRDPNTGLSQTALTNIQEGNPTKRNTSGVRGVYWNKWKQKWIATGRIDGKGCELGSFDSLEEAKAERKRFVRMRY